MSNIKDFFVSRWGEDGYVVEADFSQLEVIGLAILSNDPVLKADIRAGTDMHCMNASFLYGEPYEYIRKQYLAEDPEWTKKRKKAKPCGFLIQYGGGAGEMAKQTGMPLEQCKEFIENYYERYKRVKEWQDEVQATVKRSRKVSKLRTDKGYPAGKGEYVNPTGRKFIFREYDAPEFMARKGEPTSFSPTQMKNYPVNFVAA